MELLTVEQLSVKIHKAKASIYSDLIRNPESLPPVLKITGSRRVFFKDVDQWLSSQMHKSTTPSNIAKKAKRGRPPKQLKHQVRVNDASSKRHSRVNNTLKQSKVNH